MNEKDLQTTIEEPLQTQGKPNASSPSKERFYEKAEKEFLSKEDQELMALLRARFKK